VTTPGGRLVRRNGSLAVFLKEQLLAEIPLYKTNVVVLGTQVTTPALLLLLRTGGKVVMLSRSGKVIGAAWPSTEPKLEQIKAQIALENRPQFRLELAKTIVEGKIKSQCAYLQLRARWASKQRLSPEIFRERKNQIEKLLPRIAEATTLSALRGLEGLASRLYFAALGDYWRSKGLKFQGRRAHPPRDLANAALSYGYGVLQSYVVVAMHAAGLLPSPGILHEDELHYAPMVYDLMEEFRVAAVDMVVSKLLANRTLNPKLTERKSGAVYLNELARKRLVQALSAQLEKNFYNPTTNATAPLREHLFTQAAKLAQSIREERPYSAFHLTVKEEQ